MQIYYNYEEYGRWVTGDKWIFIKALDFGTSSASLIGNKDLELHHSWVHRISIKGERAINFLQKVSLMIY